MVPRGGGGRSVWDPVGVDDLPGNDFQSTERVFTLVLCEGVLMICGSIPDCPFSEPSLPERRNTHAQPERH